MPGQDGRASTGGVVGTAVLLAAVLVSAVGVAALRSDTADADTVLVRGDGVTFELADGTTRPGEVGEAVPRGATVRAGVTGAELQTRDRKVLLGGQTAVTVLDGVRQELLSGFVLVEASDAPGLELQTPAAAVTTADDSLVRVDAGSLLRVGVLRGDAAAVRAVGRRATAQVDTYFQVQVPAGGLPGPSTPFVLTPGDAYERRLAADLVRADEDLNALASRLDSDGSAGRAVTVALTDELDGVAVAPGSEGAVGYLIARASDETDLATGYTTVRGLREDGGSWGIVAAIVSAPVDEVSAALGALLDPGTVPVVASRPLDADAVLDLGGSSGGEPTTPDGPRPAPQPTGGGGGGGTPDNPEPTPTPSPTEPTDPVTDVVDDVVDTVTDLIDPSPSPTSSAPRVPDPVLPVLDPVLDPLLEPLEPLLK